MLIVYEKYNTYILNETLGFNVEKETVIEILLSEDENNRRRIIFKKNKGELHILFR